MHEIKETVFRDIPALAQDFAGALALIVVLLVGLNLPLVL